MIELLGDPTLVPVAAPIRKVARDTVDTFTLTLEMPAPFRFQAGQFNMLYAFGVGEVPISISGDPNADDQLVVHTIRAVGAVTRALQRLRAGDVVGVRGPFGAAWPLEAARAKDVLLMAGGIGLAPLRPVIYEVLGRRHQFDRFTLLYGARTPGDLLYLPQLEKWRGRLDTNLQVTVDQGNAAWRGQVGVVTTLLPRVDLDPHDTIAMLCGPEVMMRFAVRALQQAGLRDDHIYVSMERNMHCAVGTCGHCQFGPSFVCKDGPVFRYDRVAPYLGIREF